MQALADRVITLLLALAGFAALRAIAGRAHDELAAERRSAARRDERHDQALLELVAAVQSPGQHIPMLDNEPGLSKLTVSEQDEIDADAEGMRQTVAEAILADLDERERRGIPTTDDERVHLRDMALGLKSALSAEPSPV